MNEFVTKLIVNMTMLNILDGNISNFLLDENVSNFYLEENVNNLFGTKM